MKNINDKTRILILICFNFFHDCPIPVFFSIFLKIYQISGFINKIQIMGTIIRYEDLQGKVVEPHCNIVI